MTRWARAGSTQKHRKMPEDSTPWEEFVSQRKTLATTEKKFLGNKIKKISNEVAQTSLKKKLKQRLKKTKLQRKQNNSSLLIENDYNDMNLTLKSDSTQDGLDSHGDGLEGFEEHREPEICSMKNKKILKFHFKGEFSFQGEEEASPKSKKLKTGKKKVNKNAIQASVPSGSENFDVTETNLFVPSANKKHKTGKKKYIEPFLSGARIENEEERKLITDSENEEDRKMAGEDEEEESKTADPKSSHTAAECTKSGPCRSGHIGQQKKKSFFERVKENRTRNGILLLPNDVESRLYRMKRSLRAKGFSGEQIKRMVRDARRKAELMYRKTLKTCFNCRETGHVLANCPKITEDSEQGTGICFKCGSAEHVSYKCHIKTSEFPFAKCFVCHNIGHISRNCPENKHGVYPKGGKCNLCGSIDHLRKDCPKTSKKKGEEEVEITARMINEFRSVDDEVEEMEFKPVKQKKPKVVKF